MATMVLRVRAGRQARAAPSRSSGLNGGTDRAPLDRASRERADLLRQLVRPVQGRDAQGGCVSSHHTTRVRSMCSASTRTTSARAAEAMVKKRRRHRSRRLRPQRHGHARRSSVSTTVPESVFVNAKGVVTSVYFGAIPKKKSRRRASRRCKSPSRSETSARRAAARRRPRCRATASRRRVGASPLPEHAVQRPAAIAPEGSATTTRRMTRGQRGHRHDDAREQQQDEVETVARREIDLGAQLPASASPMPAQPSRAEDQQRRSPRVAPAHAAARAATRTRRRRPRRPRPGCASVTRTPAILAPIESTRGRAA